MAQVAGIAVGAAQGIAKGVVTTSSGGGGGFTPSLKFNDSRNSQYWLFFI